jgi:hypothetical protein
MTLRTFALFGLLCAAELAFCPVARAQSAPPPEGPPAAPGVVASPPAAPGVVASPMYAPGPPRFIVLRTERRSAGAMAAGITLGALGFLSTTIGVLLLEDASGLFDSMCLGCAQPGKAGEKNAGIALIIGGLGGLAIGAPLIVWGVKRVPVPAPLEAPQASAVPTVRVGVNNVQLGWHF